MRPGKSTLPVTIIGGYLGAGKTTLINRLLRRSRGRRLAVLVNDFGDLNIDADLIEARGAQVLGLAGGCICCSTGGDLVGALQQLAESDQALDRILIETSGVALPAAVAAGVQLVTGLSVDAVWSVAALDTIVARTGDAYVGDTVVAQLRQADAIVFSRRDLCSVSGERQAIDHVTRLAPAARLIMTAVGELSFDELIHGHPARPGPARQAAGGSRAGAQLRSTHGSIAQALARGDRRLRAPGPGPASAVFDSVAFSIDCAVDVVRLGQRLLEPALGVLRAKGRLLDIDGRIRLLQIAGGRVEVSDWPAHGRSRNVVIGDTPGRLLCIGLKLAFDRRTIEAALSDQSRPPTGRAGLPGLN